MLHCTEYYARCDWSLRFICKIIDCSLEEKVDLHKFALGKCVAKLWKLRSKSGAKMVNATFAWAFLLTRSVLVFKGGIYHLCPTIYPSVVTFCATYLQWPNLYQSFFDRLVLVCKHLTSRPCFEVKAIQFFKNFYEEEFEFQTEGNTFGLLNQHERLAVNGMRFTSWSNRPVSNNLLLIHTKHRG